MKLNIFRTCSCVKVWICNRKQGYFWFGLMNIRVNTTFNFSFRNVLQPAGYKFSKDNSSVVFHLEDEISDDDACMDDLEFDELYQNHIDESKAQTLQANCQKQTVGAAALELSENESTHLNRSDYEWEQTLPSCVKKKPNFESETLHKTTRPHHTYFYDEGQFSDADEDNVQDNKTTTECWD